MILATSQHFVYGQKSKRDRVDPSSVTAMKLVKISTLTSKCFENAINRSKHITNNLFTMPTFDFLIIESKEMMGRDFVRKNDKIVLNTCIEVY